jgi:GNAT superfamily N-acetyltransferase
MTTVRIATHDDVEALARLRFDMDREQEGGTTGFASFRETFAEWYAVHGANVTAFVAEEGNEVVGTLWLIRVARTPRPSNFDPEPLGYVTFFFVDRAHRQRGVGKALLNALTSFADEESFDTLVVWPAERAGGNYREMGFTDPPELLERLGPAEREANQS